MTSSLQRVPLPRSTYKSDSFSYYLSRRYAILSMHIHMEIKESSVAWLVPCCKRGSTIGAKVARYLLPLCFASRCLSLVCSRPLAAITRPIVISDKKTPHWLLIFPLVVMPPSLIATVLRVPKLVCPPALQDIQFVRVCTSLAAIPGAPLGQGEHPPFLIGPAPRASLLILAFARLPRSSSLSLRV